MAEHILENRRRINALFSEYTGQSVEQIEKDTDRDKIFNAEKAKEYGLVDDVLIKRK